MHNGHSWRRHGRPVIDAKAERMPALEVRALDLLTTVFTERGTCNGEPVVGSETA
jgi:hypothetical protein